MSELASGWHRVSMSIMGRSRSQQHRRPIGVASLIITVILGLAIVGVVGGLTAAAVNQARLSSDADQSARALNAALAGIDSLVNQINADPLFNTIDNDPNSPTYGQKSCNANAGEQKLSAASSGQDIAITCATAENQGINLEGYLQRDQSVIINLAGAERVDANGVPLKPRLYDGVTSMRLLWNKSDTDVYPVCKINHVGNPPKSPCTTTSFTATNIIQFPILNNLGSWPDKPAAMELTFMWCRKAAPSPIVFATQCQSSPGDFNPFTKSLPMFTTTVVPWLPNKDGITSSCTPSQINATIGTDYDCHIPDTLPAGQRCANCLGGLLLNSLPGVPSDLQRNYTLLVKITARYAGTHYLVDFGGYNTANDQPDAINPAPYPRYFDFPFTTLDVTARAGSIYRRVKATKTTQYSNYGITGYALWSGRNICKNLSMTQGSPRSGDGINNCPGPDANEP